MFSLCLFNSNRYKRVNLISNIKRRWEQVISKDDKELLTSNKKELKILLETILNLISNNNQENESINNLEEIIHFLMGRRTIASLSSNDLREELNQLKQKTPELFIEKLTLSDSDASLVYMRYDLSDILDRLLLTHRWFITESRAKSMAKLTYLQHIINQLPDLCSIGESCNSNKVIVEAKPIVLTTHDGFKDSLEESTSEESYVTQYQLFNPEVNISPKSSRYLKQDNLEGFFNAGNNITSIGKSGTGSNPNIDKNCKSKDDSIKIQKKQNILLSSTLIIKYLVAQSKLQRIQGKASSEFAKELDDSAVPCLSNRLSNLQAQKTIVFELFKKVLSLFGNNIKNLQHIRRNLAEQKYFFDYFSTIVLEYLGQNIYSQTNLFSCQGELAKLKEVETSLTTWLKSLIPIVEENCVNNSDELLAQQITSCCSNPLYKSSLNFDQGIYNDLEQSINRYLDETQLNLLAKLTRFGVIKDLYLALVLFNYESFSIHEESQKLFRLTE